jgi:hypothetical protein
MRARVDKRRFGPWALITGAHTSVSAGADVARAREFETGRISSLTANANVSASLNAKAISH